MDRGAWRAIVRWVTQSQTRLKLFSTHAHAHNIPGPVRTLFLEFLTLDS